GANSEWDPCPGRTVEPREAIDPALALGSPGLALQEAEVGFVHREAQQRGSRRSEGTHRSREGHANHRPDLSIARGPRGGPVSRRGTPSSQDRHHGLTRLPGSRELWPLKTARGRFNREGPYSARDQAAIIIGAETTSVTCRVIYDSELDWAGALVLLVFVGPVASGNSPEPGGLPVGFDLHCPASAPRAGTSWSGNV